MRSVQYKKKYLSSDADNNMIISLYDHKNCVVV